ncbi:hypothetical protein KC722_01025 [Candidatus Kaiserbacteria bacterium]|nr:hypothetical protein [Candidatus Kaiserbacteria bacterium]
MIIVVKATTETELNRLTSVEKMPEGMYAEVGDGPENTFSFALFRVQGDERIETDTDLLLADALEHYGVEYVLFTATEMNDAAAFVGSLNLGNIDAALYTVEEFFAYKNQPLN